MKKNISVVCASVGLLAASGCLVPPSQTELTSSTASALAAPVTISASANNKTGLGTVMTVPLTLQGVNGYTGPVGLAVNPQSLVAVDPRLTVQAAVMPSTVDLSSGSATATLTVSVPAEAPDLTGEIQVSAGAGGAALNYGVPIEVLPVYEIDILTPVPSGGSVEGWTLPAFGTVSFAQHLNGITVKFVNMDSSTPSATRTAHEIHSNPPAGGGIPHEQGSLGLPGSTTPSGGDTVGDTYSVTVMNQTPNAQDTVYCHPHESTGARTLVFNAFAAPTPTPTNTGNPNASFAYIRNNMITPMCASCHVSIVSGGVNMSSYSALMSSGAVTPGNASNSSLYTAIIPGGNMPANGPGTVPSAIADDVRDWINAGAPNN